MPHDEIRFDPAKSEPEQATNASKAAPRPPLPEDPGFHNKMPFPSHVLNAGFLTISIAGRVGNEYLIYA